MSASATLKAKLSLASVVIAVASLSAIPGCAKVEAPGGGPEDKSPPEIVSIKPDSGATTVPVASRFEIEFSEDMNQPNTEKAIFISPLFFNYPEFEWSGKKLTIRPPELLRENTTYVLIIGASAMDTRGNRLGKTLSFPFSTGEAIYHGAIWGRVLSDESNLGVWAYEVQSGQPDTFWMRVPDYVTEPDSLGEFRLEFLSYGTYLIVSVSDKNSDQFWAPPGEKIALPEKLVTLSVDRLSFGPLILMTVDRDTTRPAIAGISSPDNRSVRIEFSQQMDTLGLFDVANYRIRPMGDTAIFTTVEQIFPTGPEVKGVFIRCGELEPERRYSLEAFGLSSVYGVTSDSLSRLFAASGPDTTAPAVALVEPKPGGPFRPGITINFWFSEGIDTTDFRGNLSVTDTGLVVVPFEYSWRYMANLMVVPDFKAGESYVVSLTERAIRDLSGNLMGDTVVSYKYHVAPEDTFGQVTGKVANAPGSAVTVVASRDRIETQTAAGADGIFLFDQLFPGAYRLRAFYDRNGNGIFDGGRMRPLEYAEPLTVYGDTVQVRSRWETDIGVLDFGR